MFGEERMLGRSVEMAYHGHAWGLGRANTKTVSSRTAQAGHHTYEDDVSGNLVRA